MISSVRAVASLASSDSCSFPSEFIFFSSMAKASAMFAAVCRISAFNCSTSLMTSAPAIWSAFVKNVCAALKALLLESSKSFTWPSSVAIFCESTSSCLFCVVSALILFVSVWFCLRLASISTSASRAFFSNRPTSSFNEADAFFSSSISALCSLSEHRRDLISSSCRRRTSASCLCVRIVCCQILK